MKNYTLKVSGSFVWHTGSSSQANHQGFPPPFQTVEVNENYSKIRCLLLLVGLLLHRAVKSLHYLPSWLDYLVRINLKFRITIIVSSIICVRSMAALVFMYHYKVNRDCYNFSCCLYNLQVLVSFHSANSHKLLARNYCWKKGSKKGFKKVKF